MKIAFKFLPVLIILVLVQMACNFPTSVVSNARQTPTATPAFPDPFATPTNTLPPVITATSPAQPQATATQAPTATSQPAANQPTATRPASSGATCTYLATFVSDVTIPDDSVITAGKQFVKTWRVRNDGTCTWGPNQALRALAFVSGSRMDAPEQVTLPGEVAPGKTVDLSVTFTSPAKDGTYTSEWKFRMENGQTVGVGTSKAGALYVRIKVGSTPAVTTTRVKFASGATSAVVTGDLKAKETRAYVLSAMRDQVLMANLSTDKAKIKITAADGTALSGTPNPSGTNAIAILPSNQDYTVWVTAGEEAINFSVYITIPSRITFEEDAVSDKVSGKTSGRNAVSYVLRALEGQTMTVEVKGSNLGLTIYGLKDGTPLVRAEGGATSWSGKLPATQDYILMVVPAVDNAEYTMEVTIK